MKEDNGKCIGVYIKPLRSAKTLLFVKITWGKLITRLQEQTLLFYLQKIFAVLISPIVENFTHSLVTKMTTASTN
jgi:hypothetical protein